MCSKPDSKCPAKTSNSFANYSLCWTITSNEFLELNHIFQNKFKQTVNNEVKPETTENFQMGCHRNSIVNLKFTVFKFFVRTATTIHMFIK